VGSEPAWKAYERQIYARLKAAAGADADLTFDKDGRQRLPGKFSGIDRQVDVLVRGKVGGIGNERIMASTASTASHEST